MARLKSLREPVELKVVNTWTNQPDNLFVCWGSPEERCKGSIMKFSPAYRAEHVLLLKYSDHDSQKRRQNIKEMIPRLKKVGKIEQILLDEDQPLPVLRETCERIEKLAKRTKEPRITIDISTPIKWHLLIFLKFLDLRDLLKDARFLYTEPEEYIIDLFQSLSFGVKEIFPIPMFYGNYDFSKEDLLILMLGYEGSRAMALYEDLDPADCLLLIPDPPYRQEWRGRTEQLNEEIINAVGKSKIQHIDSRDPVKVAVQFQKILSDRKYEKYNQIISPLGTKPQALGLYLYLSANMPNAILIYGAPLRHNEFFYSSGIGRTWQLPY